MPETFPHGGMGARHAGAGAGHDTRDWPGCSESAVRDSQGAGRLGEQRGLTSLGGRVRSGVSGGTTRAEPGACDAQARGDSTLVRIWRDSVSLLSRQPLRVVDLQGSLGLRC